MEYMGAPRWHNRIKHQKDLDVAPWPAFNWAPEVQNQIQECLIDRVTRASGIIHNRAGYKIY